MPYREPPRARKVGADVDPGLLRAPWWVPLLVVSILVMPPWLTLTWLTDMEVRGCGPTHAETFAEKLTTTIVFALCVSTLLWFRARHRRRERAALLALHADDAADSKADPARVRVHVERMEESGVEEPPLADEPAEQKAREPNPLTS